MSSDPEPSSAPRAAAPLNASALEELLRSMGVEEYEPRVLHQLLEYMEVYTTEVFAEAAQFAEHAGRPGQLECEDVQLSARLKAAVAQTHQPQLLDWMARARNQEILAVPIKSNIQLPVPKLCMVEENWQYATQGPSPAAAPDASWPQQAAPAQAARGGSGGGDGASGAVAFRLGGGAKPARSAAVAMDTS